MHLKRLPPRLLDIMVRYLVGRRLRSGLVVFGACAMTIIAIATLHNESVLRAQSASKMTQHSAATRALDGHSADGTSSKGGALSWESPEDAFWRKPYELFGSSELRLLKPLVENYLNAIRRLRYSLLSANRTWTSVEDEWTLLNGYDGDYFTRVLMSPQVNTVFLTADFDALAERMLPARGFYDYAGDCSILTDKRRAIYPNADELLNKTCRDDVRETLRPAPVDRTILSLGLPFQMSATAASPTGLAADKVILTFLNIVQNGVVTTHGEVLSGNIGIMTQRCSLSSYKPQLPDDAELLPMYDEVLTITQQTLVWYYHGTIEDLPRIAPYLELLRDNPHIKVHVTRTTSGFHETMLAYLGIGAARVVSGPVRGRIVYLPAGTTCGRPPVFNTQLLAAIFRQRIIARSPQTKLNDINNENNGGKASSADNVRRGTQELPVHMNNTVGAVGSKKATLPLTGGRQMVTLPAGTRDSLTAANPVPQDTIIVIRRSSPDRQFLHHDAIVDMLQAEAAAHGALRVRVFTDNPLPPLTDYMRLFHRARLIVAPHGAGLSNLLFAQPGTAVIEGLCEMEPHWWFCFQYGILPWLCHSHFSRVSLSFRNLATVLGQHYAGVYIPEGCLHIKPEHLRPHVRLFLDNLR